MLQPLKHSRPPLWFVASLLATIALFLLWPAHQNHLLAALPYLFLLACPLLHLFLHRGHAHRPGHPDSAN
jgi:hypothetical protein